MDAELLVVVLSAVGVTVVVLTRLHVTLTAMELRLSNRIGALETSLGERIGALEVGLGRLDRMGAPPRIPSMHERR